MLVFKTLELSVDITSSALLLVNQQLDQQLCERFVVAFSFERVQAAAGDSAPNSRGSVTANVSSTLRPVGPREGQVLRLTVFEILVHKNPT